MKKVVGFVLLTLLCFTSLEMNIQADSKAHNRAIKICRQRYKAAIKGTKYLKSRERHERIAQARREREECERLAPK